VIELRKNLQITGKILLKLDSNSSLLSEHGRKIIYVFTNISFLKNLKYPQITMDYYEGMRDS